MRNAFVSLLLGRVPVWLAAQAIAGVCMALSMIAFLLAGAISETELGPFLHQIVAVSVAVPIVVVMPLVTVVLRVLRDTVAQRDRAVAVSGTDELTGLPNRRRLIGIIDRELAVARRAERTVTIALLDVDDFKSVNDTHGHQTGDRLLAAIASACDRTLRSADVVGRWGGEEFVVVMPDTGAHGAEVLLERLRAAVAEVEVRDDDGTRVRRSASIGAVTIDPASATHGTPAPVGVVAVADRAMYGAKLAGKDQVRVDVLEAPVRPAPERREAVH